MQQAVYIAGRGAISAIGKNREENLEALKKGETGIGPIQYLSTAHAGLFPAGEVKVYCCARSLTGSRIAGGKSGTPYC